MSDKLRELSKSEIKAGQNASGNWESFFRSEPVNKPEDISETARITEVQDKHQQELLTMENVVGVAVSLKVKKGKPTKKWALSVMVEKKLPKTQLSKDMLVPEDVGGVETDVVEVGKIEALAFTSQVRPALPGHSIGHYNITAGTFGCIVRDIRRCCCDHEPNGCRPANQRFGSDYLILSNNHVLANTNQAEIGDLILQPGPFDGGVFPSDACAVLDRFEPIVLSQFSNPSGFNLVDAACARPMNSRNLTGAIIGQILPRGIDQAIVGSQVIKVGRTTEVTFGRVLATNATVNVGYGAAGVAQFRHQIITTAMADGGDSGSLLMDVNFNDKDRLPSYNAVGLLFAGSFLITIHNHIADVEAALGVRPLTAPRSS